MFAAATGASNAIPVIGPAVSGAISGGYAGYMSYQNGASMGEAIFCGSVSALFTGVSIGNLANIAGISLDLFKNATVDLIFGTAYNSISAATYRSVTENAQNRNIQNIPSPQYPSTGEKSGKGNRNLGNKGFFVVLD